MKTSQNGIGLIKRFEGLRLEAYGDGASYSVGYGHHGVAAGTRVTEAEAEALLKGDLQRIEAYVEGLGLGLNQNEFDALVSLSYNIGTGRLASSTLLRLLREDRAPREELRAAWSMWRHSGGQVSAGLERRRRAEYALYSSTVEEEVGALVPPLLAGVAVALLIALIVL